MIDTKFVQPLLFCLVSQATNQDCFHCGLPVPANADYTVDIAGQHKPMCCLGCQAVAQAIVDNGLTNFYQHREGSGTKPDELVPEALQRMELYDQDALQENFVSTDEKNLKHAALLHGPSDKYHLQ